MSKNQIVTNDNGAEILVVHPDNLAEFIAECVAAAEEHQRYLTSADTDSQPSS
jgi:hypothetical protein